MKLPFVMYSCLLFTFLGSTTLNAKPKQSDYLEGKKDDAALICREQIVATAKDPSSLQFEDKYTYGFGNALTKNWIYITWNSMGKNTYGAVLRHVITCTVSCKQDKPCSFVEMKDAS